MKLPLPSEPGNLCCTSCTQVTALLLEPHWWPCLRNGKWYSGASVTPPMLLGHLTTDGHSQLPIMSAFWKPPSKEKWTPPSFLSPHRTLLHPTESLRRVSIVRRMYSWWCLGHVDEHVQSWEAFDTLMEGFANS